MPLANNEGFVEGLAGQDAAARGNCTTNSDFCLGVLAGEEEAEDGRIAGRLARRTTKRMRTLANTVTSI